ncbi:MAG: cobalt transporter [Alphaproteobacteria bacterium]|nr:cobalt transporter [Alphaproteobacteria bacterium]
MTKRTFVRAATDRDVSADVAETFSPRLAGVLALVFGAFVIFGAGFAAVAHDAAHDTRHAFVFPCH